MTPPSPLLSLLLILALVTGNLASSLKVLDFSADNNGEPDSNGEYTSATLDAGPLPQSFTICSAIMVDAWTTEFSSADMFILLDVDGDMWGNVHILAGPSYTPNHYNSLLGPVKIIETIGTVFFPLQCTMRTLSS